MKIRYVVVFDFTKDELIKIKLTEEECEKAYESKELEEFLSTIEKKYKFDLNNSFWTTCEIIRERCY